jgi:hypothetical protein
MSQLALPAPVDTRSRLDLRNDTDLRNDSLPGLVIPPDPTDAAEVAGALSPATLAGIAQSLASQVELWRPLLHVNVDRRWYTRLRTGDGWEAWLLTWLPGQGTDLHDHGGSAGAFTVLFGELAELTPAGTTTEPARTTTRVLRSPRVRAFGPSHIHQVTGVGDTTAASLHVYGPALTVMNRYQLDPATGPVLVETDRAGQDW